MITSGAGPNQLRPPNRLLETYTTEELKPHNQLAVTQLAVLLAPYGQLVTRETTPQEWATWERIAEQTGSTIPERSSLGRVVEATERPLDTVLTLSHIALLGEQESVMPAQEGGRYVGRAFVQARRLETLPTQLADFHYSIYSDGTALLAHSTITIPQPPDVPDYGNYLHELWEQLCLSEITEFPERTATISHEPVGPHQITALGKYVIAHQT